MVESIYILTQITSRNLKSILMAKHVLLVNKDAGMIIAIVNKLLNMHGNRAKPLLAPSIAMNIRSAIKYLIRSHG